MSLNNLTIGRRLGLGFGTMSVLLMLLAALAWGVAHTLNQSTSVVMAEADKALKARGVSAAIDGIYLNMWSLIANKDLTEKQKNIAQIAGLRESYKKSMEELKAAISSETGQALLANVDAAIAAARDINLRVVDLALHGQDEVAMDLFLREGTLSRQKLEAMVGKFLSWGMKRIQEAEESAETAYDGICWLLGIGAALGLAIAALFGVVISRSITIPLADAIRFTTQQLAQGDFSHDPPETSKNRGDEIGDLAGAFQSMSGSLRGLLRNLAGGIQTVSSSATELSAISAQTTQNVQTLSARTTAAAAAAEQSSANTASVAASMEQAALNLASVASATEEMSATIGEIAANSEKARAISRHTGDQAASVSALMQELSQAAQEIGKVTEAITNISAQTNLLALNATIEAARAGAAGKGFAVVAHEIKELARQTAGATEDIKTRISGMQHATRTATHDIQKITVVIADVGHLIAGIASAIEEQTTVTHDVARNIAQASYGVQDANERIAQTASVSRSMAQDIAEVNRAAGEIRAGGEQVRASAVELSSLAEQLRSMVSQFRV